MKASLRVLLIAEAANPDWVSVPLVGWSLAAELRGVVDVHLVTQIRNRDAILKTGLREGIDFTVIDSEPVARPFHRAARILRVGAGKGWTMATAINAISYPYFEHLVWKHFANDIRAGAYDIVHRVTPLSPAIGSPIAVKCAAANIPFVLGPLNGGVPWPQGFDAERRREGEWLSYVRGIYKVLPRRLKTLKAASIIIAGSHIAEAEIPNKYRQKTIYLPENGINTEFFNLVAKQDISGPLRACFIGRLVPLKGVDMLLEAAAPLLRDGRLQLDIIGDGPLRDALKAQTVNSCTTKAVVFHGHLDHGKLQTVVARSNLLTFPSIREFGGGVVLEAMSLGVVPVVIDYAGPGELVTEDTGYKVPLGSRAQIIQRFRAQLEEIDANPEVLVDKAIRARLRVQNLFTWQIKAQQIRKIYDWVLDARLEKPSFF